MRDPENYCEWPSWDAHFLPCHCIPAICELCLSWSLHRNRAKKINLCAQERVRQENSVEQPWRWGLGWDVRDRVLSLEGLSSWWEVCRSLLSRNPWATPWVPLGGAWLRPPWSFLLYLETVPTNPAPGQLLILRIFSLPGRPQIFNRLKRKAPLIWKRRASQLLGDLIQLPVLLLTGWNEQGRELSAGMDTNQLLSQ